MVHTLSETLAAQNDEKEVKRIKSLEFRVSELENNLLKASTAALEKRVQELERELRASNEECQKLRDTISQMEGSASCAGKTKATENSSPSPVENSEKSNHKPVEVEANANNEKSDKDRITESSHKLDDTSKNPNSESSNTEGQGKEASLHGSDAEDEEDSTYQRILKIIENMRIECIRSINFKIPTGSRLPKNPFMKRQDSKPNLRQGAQSPVTPTSPASPVATTKLPLRPRTPSSASLQSRPGTPSSIPSTPTSGIPNLLNGVASGIPSKTMTHPARSQSMSSATPVWPSVNSSSRPTTPVWPSSPLSTHKDIVDEPQQLKPQVRTGIPVFGTGNSRPTTPVQTSSSPPSYHPNLSISPPPIQHFELNPSKNTSIPQLRTRASSYTISGISRPNTPTRNVHLFYPHDKLAQVQY